MESTISQESSREQQPTSASERQVPRPPRPHPLPPRLTIHAVPAPPQELGPPVQVTNLFGVLEPSLKAIPNCSPSCVFAKLLLDAPLQVEIPESHMTELCFLPL